MYLVMVSGEIMLPCEVTSRGGEGAGATPEVKGLVVTRGGELLPEHLVQ